LQLGFSLLKTRIVGPIQLIQIGAFDGKLADPLETILQDRRVVALLVEPQLTPFQALVNRYSANPRIRLANCVVGNSDGEATLYVPGIGASPEASLNPRFYRRFGLSRSSVREIQVTSCSVTSLLAKYAVGRVNVLQLDTEGYDFEILSWFFAAGQQPELVNFESLHLSRTDRQASREFLRKAYCFVETEQDTFAIKESLIADP